MTIAATMLVADYVGIPVVTGGGIGGVHRGAEISMDISSDLEEIAIRNVIVVCSGAKSILDLKLTMEYLETKAYQLSAIKPMNYQHIWPEPVALNLAVEWMIYQ